MISILYELEIQQSQLQPTLSESSVGKHKFHLLGTFITKALVPEVHPIYKHLLLLVLSSCLWALLLTGVPHSNYLRSSRSASSEKHSLLKSLTSCCRSSLQVARDKSPYWMCWAERITGAAADVWPDKVTHGEVISLLSVDLMHTQSLSQPKRLTEREASSATTTQWRKLKDIIQHRYQQ